MDKISLASTSSDAGRGAVILSKMDAMLKRKGMTAEKKALAFLEDIATPLTPAAVHALLEGKLLASRIERLGLLSEGQQMEQAYSYMARCSSRPCASSGGGAACSPHNVMLPLPPSTMR